MSTPLTPRSVEFKTSVALALSGLDVPAKKLQDLCGREKPPGQHHMRYTPADVRVAKYRAAGVEPPVTGQLALTPKMPPVIVTRMTKGGVGKTSIAVNVAACMSMMGFRVLVIDADPQASASNLLGVFNSSFQSDDEEPVHIGTLLRKGTSAPDPELPAVIQHIYEGGLLDLIPSDITLSEVDAALVTAMSSHTRAELFFTRNSAYFAQHYDVIIVDTAPGTTPIGMAFTYAARQSGKILAIVEPEGACLRALDSLSSNLTEIKTLTGAIVGMEVVINKYHSSLKHVRESMGFLYSKYGNMLNDVIIPQSSSFSRQLIPGDRLAGPVVENEPSSVASTAVIDLTKALCVSFGVKLPGLE